ncbi:hypothetical protein [Sulfuracidifex metallicus]|uniref:Uncharacterized protein n=1 Tax=Sulfuracidifex metallicus DSM 6482 = JCM 9184 TaxID=523847 RepID=A0A6A9QL30_SULME|nr:hypothetical protein [Sulfuracidifex metallicus]MUN29294.1 hypothetical protein [Sulfuracidifex metallicus DSM 6482 = JCM 9184]WOE50192.1 hypothetical protein RQ359_001700 [Sulfuracidifex metallicus DSM 6482 = JCM 9184]
MLDEVTRKFMKEKNKDNAIIFLKEVSKLIPPSDDFSIFLVKRGPHEYHLDRKGLFIQSVSEDEYLPFLSGSEKRVDFSSLPEDAVKKIDYVDVLKQLRDILLDFSRRGGEKYTKMAEEVNILIFQNL